MCGRRILVGLVGISEEGSRAWWWVGGWVLPYDTLGVFGFSAASATLRWKSSCPVVQFVFTDDAYAGRCRIWRSKLITEVRMMEGSILGWTLKVTVDWE